MGEQGNHWQFLLSLSSPHSIQSPFQTGIECSLSVEQQSLKATVSFLRDYIIINNKAQRGRTHFLNVLCFIFVLLSLRGFAVILGFHPESCLLTECTGR